MMTETKTVQRVAYAEREEYERNGWRMWSLGWRKSEGTPGGAWAWYIKARRAGRGEAAGPATGKQ